MSANVMVCLNCARVFASTRPTGQAYCCAACRKADQSRGKP